MAETMTEPLKSEINDTGVDGVDMTVNIEAMAQESVSAMEGVEIHSAEPIEQETIPEPEPVSEQPSKRKRSEFPEEERDSKRHKDADTANDTEAHTALPTRAEFVPAFHAPTRALYIKNIVRPLSTDALHTHLQSLVEGLNGDSTKENVDIYVDRHQTHSFAVFDTYSAAQSVRESLHGSIWPQEGTQKPLWVDFVPSDMVPEWIATEKGSENTRWEVKYGQNEAGETTAELAALEDGPPPNAPSGPKAFDSMLNAPREPRADREAAAQQLSLSGRLPVSRDGNNIVWTPLDEVLTTTTCPPITFQMVAPSYVSKRVEDMQAYYAKDESRQNRNNNTINRFSFAHSTIFVDRGPEVYAGIRPPPKEADSRSRRYPSPRRSRSRSRETRRMPSQSEVFAFEVGKPKKRRHRGGRRAREKRERLARERGEAGGRDRNSSLERLGKKSRSGRRRRAGGRGRMDSYKPSYDDAYSKPCN